MGTLDRKSGYYNDHETLAYDDLLELKLANIKKVVQSAWEKSPTTRARLEKSGVNPDSLSSLDAFSAIPVLSKKELIPLQQQNLQDLLTCDKGDLSRIYMSPGPIYDPEGRTQNYWGWAEAFYAAGFRAKDLVQMTFSYHLTPAGLMLEEPLRELQCCVIPAGPGNSEVQMELMHNLQVNGFVGMTSFLKIIGEKAKKKGFDPQKDFALEVAFVAAEVLTPSLREEVEELFGMLVRQGYGTADVGCIGYECQHLTGMHISTRCHVEICDPATGKQLPPGEVGEVVVTPLTTDYPLIRLGTGDLSKLDVSSCPCGRTSPRLMGILGRTDSTAKVKGQFIYPHQVKEVVSGFPQIKGWQVVVSNPDGRDMLALRVEADETLDQKSLVAQFQSMLKLRPAIIVDNSGTLSQDKLLPLVDERTWE